MESVNLNPTDHPAGTKVTIRTVDNLGITGVIKAYTSDAVEIKTSTTIVTLHPHEIYLCLII